ncbi:MAG: hypothetical protein V1813_03480 [Candidatus Aenigmatarchaeota archaeon]
MAAMISLVQPSLAIGISPGRIEITFVPGQNSTYDMYVVGGGTENIVVSSKQTETCGLSQYIVPEKTEFVLDPGEKAYFSVNVALPSDYPRPGLHDCAIVAEEVPVTGNAGVSAFAAVQAQFWIRVPYPERYLEGRLVVSNVNLSETAHFAVNLGSMGLKDVTASALITVTDSSGRNVATLQTGNAFIESMGSGTLEASWDTSGMPAGRYYAEALVEYGGEKPLSLSSGFKIGDVLVKIINVTYPEEIFPDGIARLDVLVDSYWNDRIEGSYMTLEMEKDGDFAGSGRSESFDLEPWEERLVPIYWDTRGLSEGEYDAVLAVHYAGKEERSTLALKIVPRQDPYMMLLLLLIAIAVAIAIAVVYAFMRKRRRK